MESTRRVAVDVGASGGTVVLGGVEGGRLSFEEVYRFDNDPVERDGRYVWDVEHLREEILTGVAKADERADVASVGIDTWGVDFGLLADGELLRDPTSYRDPALSSTLEDLLAAVPKRELFEATGINHWNVPNTLWQYHYLAREDPDLLDRADAVVMMPQLLSLLLGGEACAEATVASTSQMLDPQSRTWATEVLDALDLPTDPLPRIEEPGTVVGRLDVEAGAAALGAATADGTDSEGDDDPPEIDSDPELLLPASHDSAAAVAGLPLTGDDRTFLSTGSWFIAGVEVDGPIRSAAAFEMGASNELGVDGTVRFLSNVNGFFLFEECRKSWRGRGEPHDYDALVEAAAEADRDGPLLDPDDDAFTIEGDMTDHVSTFCRGTDQPVPDGPGETTRAIFESLALKTAITVEEIESVAGVDGGRVHLGGGGARNDLFCEWLASALDRPVHAGPVEATAVGNLLTQAAARAELADLDEGREVVRESVEIRAFEPDGGGYWDRRREEMERLLGR
ncbi:MAG: rhamnulokinase family protein [Haloarculaceae archaeon]